MYLGTVEIQTNLYTNLPKPSTVCLVSISSQTSRPYTPQKFPRPTPNWLRKSLDVIFFHIFFQYIFGTFFRENAEQSASNNNFPWAIATHYVWGCLSIPWLVWIQVRQHPSLMPRLCFAPFRHQIEWIRTLYWIQHCPKQLFGGDN